VSFDDWLLFVHVAAAFAVVAGVTVFTILVFTTRRMDRPGDVLPLFRIGDPANILVQGGSVVALLVGIWLAIRLPQYHPWDGWLIGAYVLWSIAGGVGGATGKEYARIRKSAQELVAAGKLEPSGALRAELRSTKALVLHLVVVAAVLALVVDMIFKPGA
jgi:uncharacterized membrane protein